MPLPSLSASWSQRRNRTQMSRIFISYRRTDSEHIVGRIYDYLVRAFGSKNLFKDVDSIRAGIDFRSEIKKAVESCDVVIAVIGPGWLNAADADGKRRLDSPDDFVRLEIEAALERKIPVIPALVGGAAMPRKDHLPPSMVDLAFRHSVVIRADPDFVGDANKLIRSVAALLPRTYQRWLRLRAIGTAAAALIAVGAVFWRFPSSQIPPSDGSAPAPAVAPSGPAPIAAAPASIPVTGASPREASTGTPTSLIANEHIVWDSTSGRAWARDIFLVGTTKELFKASTAGTATISQDLSAIEKKAGQLTLGGLSGWHVASADEMRPLKDIAGSALFRAFATRVIPGGATNVMGILKTEDGGVATWGYQHANYLQGPYENQWYQGNDFGVWLAHAPVANLNLVVSSSPERRTETTLKPILAGLLTKRGDTIDGKDEPNTNGFVGNLDADDRRTVFIYSLKGLERGGALVQAEVVLSPSQSSGKGTIAVSLYESNGMFRSNGSGDWAPKALDTPLTWDGTQRVRLTLPEHIMGNAYNGSPEWLGLHFQYTGKGDVRFKAPELVVTYIKEQDLLTKR
jgi:hypothetical protein